MEIQVAGPKANQPEFQWAINGPGVWGRLGPQWGSWAMPWWEVLQGLHVTYLHIFKLSFNRKTALKYKTV